jgi:mono/diheme cytochrome c family protein
MTDADAYALVAYLRSEIPVWNVIKPNDRASAQSLPEMPAPTGNVDPDDARGHGEYLATLMHCAACHTATDGAAFAGGAKFKLLDGRELVAPNITSDAETGIGGWTEDQIVRAVRTMTRPDGRPIEGPMARYSTVWAWLSDADARALATYIKSIGAVRTDPIAPGDSTISSQP